MKAAMYRKQGLMLLLILCIAISLFLLIFNSMRENRYFPPLPSGKYVGVIENLPLEDGVKKDTTFMIQRFEDAHLGMIVVFQEGWAPQSVNFSLLESEQVNSQIDSKLARLEPLQILNKGKVHVFSGKVEHGFAHGDLNIDGEQSLKWKMHRVSQDSIDGSNYQKEFTKIDLKKWLQAKSLYRNFRTQIASGAEISARQEEDKRQMSKFIDNAKSMQETVRKRESELKQRLQLVQLEKDKQSKVVKDLVRELQVLGRITEHGRTVRILRRLSARENKWYRAHWRAEAEVAEVRKTLGIGADFNMKQLNRDYRAALEVRALRNSIKSERAKIRELNEEYKRRTVDDSSGKSAPQLGLNKSESVAENLG